MDEKPDRVRQLESDLTVVRSQYAFVLGMLIQYLVTDPSPRGRENLAVVLGFDVSKDIAREEPNRLLAGLYREMGIPYDFDKELGGL